MKIRYTVVLSMLAGAALGAAAIEGLHAQAKPPVYTVSEIQITNLDAYLKEFAPVAQASIRTAGGLLLLVGQEHHLRARRQRPALPFRNGIASNRRKRGVMELIIGKLAKSVTNTQNSAPWPLRARLSSAHWRRAATGGPSSAQLRRPG